MSRSKASKSLLCHCTGGSGFGCWDNDTCRTLPDAACYLSMEEIFDDSNREMGTLQTFGCLPPEEGGSAMQVRLIGENLTNFCQRKRFVDQAKFR